LSKNDNDKVEQHMMKKTHTPIP